MMPIISAELASSLPRIFGEAGQRWLDRFPDTLAYCAARWQLSGITPYPALSINFVAHAVLPTGEPVVLKIGVPHRESYTEIAALQCYQGRAIARCLDAEAEVAAMLLERLQPGDMLSTITDNAQATRIAAAIMRDLPIACTAPEPFPTFAGWIERAFRRYRDRYGADGGPIDESVLADAERCLAAVQASGVPERLLHGDLHHMNILWDARRGWTAIDPKGVIGPACLEVGRFFGNQLPDTPTADALDRVLAERVAIISALLGYPPTLIWRCAFVDRVLSTCWSTEDAWVEGDWGDRLAVIRFLRQRACG